MKNAENRNGERSRVVLIPCDTYEEEVVYEKIREGLFLLGGIRSLIDPEESVLLKPNLVRKAELSKPVVTHPAIVGAMARILREEGYAKVAAGDSCGIGEAVDAAKKVGMDQVLEREGARLIEFTGMGKLEYPEGVQAKSFYPAREVMEYDALISLSKMKTHALERITGALKNQYGCIYSFHKAKGHTLYPTADSFARMLVDLNRLVKPRLFVMDGIIAMEGNGPTSGDPVPMQVLLLSKDPIALDSVFCDLVYLNPELVPTCYHGEKMGLGVWQEEKIELIAVEAQTEEITFEEARRRYGRESFVVDRSRTKRDAWARLGKLLRHFQKKPFIDPEKCIRCGICVNSCPVEGKAVQFSNGRDHIPVYHYDKCIRCFCCQEMCPQGAIQVKKSGLTRP